MSNSKEKRPSRNTLSYFRKLLVACHPTYFDSRFTREPWSLEPVTSEEDEYEIFERHFNGTVTIKEGFRRLTKMAAKGEIHLLVGSRRALVWIAAHQDVCLDHPVVVALLKKDPNGFLVAPVFSRIIGGSDGSNLILHHQSTKVPPECGWLVLRRKRLRRKFK
ncbi:MAG: hypothetical protein Q8M83_04400 [bacterium]|nr:hypothetical protein [bacterium]